MDENQEIKLPAHSSKWVDSRLWNLEFDEPLISGINCTFLLKDGLSDLTKNKLKISKYKFGTGGPRVITSYPRDSDVIENDQYFILQLDGEINLETFMKVAFFEILGIYEKVKIKIVTGHRGAPA